jgi:hypothetical protein
LTTFIAKIKLKILIIYINNKKGENIIINIFNININIYYEKNWNLIKSNFSLLHWFKIKNKIYYQNMFILKILLSY